jgi:hypothetical protein
MSYPPAADSAAYAAIQVRISWRLARVALFAGAACVVSAIVVALAKETSRRDLTA